MSTIELATVKSVTKGIEDHGMLTIWIHLSFGSCCQGFGGLCFSENGHPNEALANDFADDVCDLFGVDKLSEIPGKKCYALRCFDRWNQTIEGLEVNGRYFTITSWRRKHFENVQNPLEYEIERTSRSIQFTERQISENKKWAKEIRGKYVDWK